MPISEKTSGWLRLGLALSIALWLVFYSAWSIRVAPDALGIADDAAFVLFFALIFGVLGLAKPGILRTAAGFLWTALVVLVFLSNVLYFRFFQTWMPLSSLRHWKDVYGIRSSVRSLFRWPDALWGVAVPFLLFAAADRIKVKTRVRELVWASVIFISLISVHAWFTPGNLSYNKSSLFFEMVRQPYRIWKTQSDYEAQYVFFQKNINQLRPVNRSIYQRSTSDRHPLQIIPLKNLDTTGPTSRPNVVLVLMESFRAFESGAYGAHPSHTPQLDKIASEGIQFTKFYGNGSYTIRGEFSTLFSFLPDFYGTDAYSSYPANDYDSLPAVLKQMGYETYWISGFSVDFNNARHCLAANGMDFFFDHVPNPRKVTAMGPSDEDIDDYAERTLGSAKQPFFAEVMTLSGHFPFIDAGDGWGNHQLARGQEPTYENYVHATEYADHALGQFLSAARNTDWGRNTVFLITGDHGVWIFPDDKPIDRIRKNEIYHRLPFIMWSPELIKPARNDTLGSQIDIAPTVLDFLGRYEANNFLGTSLLRQDTEVRQVFMLQDQRWNYRNGDEYLYDAGAEGFTDHFPYISGDYDSEFEHQGFTLDEDLLRCDNPGLRTALPAARKSSLEEFVQQSLNFYSSLYYRDLIAPAK